MLVMAVGRGGGGGGEEATWVDGNYVGGTLSVLYMLEVEGRIHTNIPTHTCTFPNVCTYAQAHALDLSMSPPHVHVNNVERLSGGWSRVWTLCLYLGQHSWDLLIR